jgi:NDP-sugar pyrophosphorylase family protein
VNHVLRAALSAMQTTARAMDWWRRSLRLGLRARCAASGISDLLSRVTARRHPVRAVYTRGGWVNVNNIADLIDASGL